MKPCVEIVVQSVSIDREATTVNVDDPLKAYRVLSFEIDRADVPWWMDRIGKTVVLYTDNELRERSPR